MRPSPSPAGASAAPWAASPPPPAPKHPPPPRQPRTKGGGDGLVRDVVVRGPDAAAGEHEAAGPHPPPQLLHAGADVLHVVRHVLHTHQVHAAAAGCRGGGMGWGAGGARCGGAWGGWGVVAAAASGGAAGPGRHASPVEQLGEPGRVGVHDAAGQHLVADHHQRGLGAGRDGGRRAERAGAGGALPGPAEQLRGRGGGAVERKCGWWVPLLLRRGTGNDGRLPSPVAVAGERAARRRPPARAWQP
jgi:hypothetical protein